MFNSIYHSYFNNLSKLYKFEAHSQQMSKKEVMDMKIDTKIKQLLYALSYDARATLRALNKKLKLSKQNIQYKIKKLEEDGVIEKYVAVVDIHKLGFFTYRVYLRLGKVHEQEIPEIISYLQKHQNILWFVSITGTWDFEIVFVAKDYIVFEKMLREIKEYLKEKVVKENISMSIVNLHYKKDYLIEKKRELKDIAHYGYDPETKKVDETDIHILIELSKNCRRSNQEIGNIVKVSYHTVKARIKRMEKEGIIQAYRTKIHIQKLGYKHMKAALYLYPHTEKTEKELMTFISSFPNVTYVVKILGEWAIEIEAEVENETKFYDILRTVRNKYPELISDYYTFEVVREIKLNYFPNGEELLKKKE